jgi:hypothetical protein
MIPARVLVHEFAVVFSRTIHFICSFTRSSHVAAYSSNWNVLSIERLGARCTSNIPCSYPRWEAVSPVSSWSIPMFRADFLHDASKSVQMEPNLPPGSSRQQLVIGLNVRRNQPKCSNFWLKVRSRQNLRVSYRSRRGRYQATNGNSSYIFCLKNDIYQTNESAHGNGVELSA